VTTATCKPPFTKRDATGVLRPGRALAEHLTPVQSIAHLVEHLAFLGFRGASSSGGESLGTTTAWSVHAEVHCESGNIGEVTVDPADDNDSPFAHLPMPGVGPGPLQDGPFTYERLVASTGRANLRDGSKWGKTLGITAVAVVVLVIVASILAALIR
jgi:hypothetical protein